MAGLPRVRQVVVAARELDPALAQLRAGLGPLLGEPFADPGVAAFGLRNAVFALGDTFLEVVSPIAPGTSAGRLLERRGGDCGYMVMVQVPDLGAARSRAATSGVREVFEIELPDMSEVHLHPADMRGAIVSMSAPAPPESWRWGGPDWGTRAAAGQLRVAGVTVAVADVPAVSTRWDTVLGGLPGISFASDPGERGPVELRLSADRGFDPFELGSVRVTVLAR
jgi:hypothetical protein